MSVYPGTLGGVYGPPSTDGSTIFVPVVNFATRLLSQSQAVPDGLPAGELVALNLASGDLEWKLDFASPLAGATTVVNDLVFMTTADGTVHALDGRSGKAMWSAKLPAGSLAGVTVSGGTLLAPAGSSEGGREPALLAYRLPS